MLQLSTHNLAGPSFGERPSLQDARERFGKPGLVAKAEAVLLGGPRLLLARRHFRAHPPALPAGDGWAVAPLRAHEFRFVCHVATFAEVRGSLERAGFALEGAWGNSGAPVPLDADSYPDDNVQLVGRRP